MSPRPAAEGHHYRHFLAGPTTGAGDRPLLLAVGNCQAESLRLLLRGEDVRTVRVPALHDLRPEEVAVLHAWVRASELLVVPPVADDYRGLPLGSDQLVALLPPSARVARVPLVRWAGLHPWQLVVHPPGLPDPEPPVVAYHDLRVLAEAAWARSGRPRPEPVPPSADGLREVARTSRAELARREGRAGTVVVSDLLARPSGEEMRTVNHPGNRLLEPLAARVRAALGLAALGPGVDRPLLTSVVAPLEPAVVAALQLSAPARSDWTVDGAAVTTEEVRRTHLGWYAARPDVLDVAVERAREPAGLLGVPLPG
ncbi:hypothetical protein SAMN04488570_1006 [Nocardioides scoriae]|uniref:Polysaccharide biosynthesis enzyme WcbI domain-containing protein n=1 Tax=Nocardioides scoriae TaxID=642780 RepID=A0A1H1NZF1_9ACTN|nr:WcbI family polysaccharide biosynthesis putative acetyltransferase [Nocardioides scoriae]SDS04348.1 hypothetical protein SAMN04488570_1006 [Nocardioides scoriae]